MRAAPFVARVLRGVFVTLACATACLIACSEATQKIRCNRTSSQLCDCTAYSSASDDSDNPALSEPCAQGSLSGRCCAAPGWPAVGTSCRCEIVGCGLKSASFCQCSTGFGDAKQRCYRGGVLTEPSPSAGICCRGTNYCYCSGDTKCSGHEDVEVPSCSVSDVGISCSGGTAATGATIVADCRTAVTVASSSSSSSSSSGGKTTTTCPGTGYVSCTAPSDCPCGLTCARLATNETERFCTESCSSDTDCAASTKWKLSTCNPRTQVCLP